MGNSQLQHYLPEVFLKGFGIRTGEVWRYDRADGSMKLLPPRVAGAERDLYSIITGTELCQEIETRWFNLLDGRFGPVIKKVEEKRELTFSEVRDLANFAAYLRVRTPACIRQTEASIKQLKAQIGGDCDSVTCSPGPPARGDDLFTMRNERCDTVSPSRASADLRNEVLEILVQTGMRIAQAVLHLQWTFLFASRGRSFVVGDSPFVVVPPRSHDIQLEGVGPMTPGAATFIPLSARICLRLTDGGAVSEVPAYHAIDGAAVRAMNVCQMLNAERYAFGANSTLLDRIAVCVEEAGLNLGETVIRQAASVSDSSRFLLHSFYRSKVGSEWAERIPMR